MACLKSRNPPPSTKKNWNDAPDTPMRLEKFIVFSHYYSYTTINTKRTSSSVSSDN